MFVAHKSVQVKSLIRLLCNKNVADPVRDVESVLYRRDENQTYKIMLHYTPGFITINDMPSSLFRNAHALVAVCDPCNLESINDMKELIQVGREKCSSTCMLYVVVF